MSENSGGKSVFKSRAVNSVLIRHWSLNGPFLLQPQSQSRTLSAFTSIIASDYQTHDHTAVFQRENQRYAMQWCEWELKPLKLPSSRYLISHMITIICVYQKCTAGCKFSCRWVTGIRGISGPSAVRLQFVASRQDSRHQRRCLFFCKPWSTTSRTKQNKVANCFFSPLVLACELLRRYSPQKTLFQLTLPIYSAVYSKVLFHKPPNPSIANMTVLTQEVNSFTEQPPLF